MGTTFSRVYFVIPNEPSKCSYLYECIYLANGNHEDKRSEVRMLPKGNRVGVSLLDYGDVNMTLRSQIPGIFNVGLENDKTEHRR